MDKTNVLDELSAHLQSKAWKAPDSISSDEWLTARSAPDCIVENYLFADVGVFIAPGGTGKTTLILHESICIALGLPLYGLEVKKPGPVMILTAEDSREMLVARLRAISAAMGLTDDQRRKVCEHVLISDVSGAGFKLTVVDHDVVRPAPGIEEIIAGCKAIKPVLIVVDPAVSFGVGESRVNDAEQGLIEAARRLRRALNCCVRYVHHTGKQNGRERAIDQYAGRGGSAFADGARMVTVLQSMAPSDWNKATGTDLCAGQTGLILARPKMSYAPPAGDILILREGYRFTQVDAVKTDSGEELESRAQKLLDTMLEELSKGHYPTQNSLEAVDTGLTRAELRKVIAWLKATGRIDQRDKPGAGQRGSRTYLHPVGAPDASGEQCEETPSFHAIENSALGTPPPIGKSSAAQRGAHSDFPLSYGTPNQHGAPTAHLAQRKEEKPSWASSDDWEAI
jgi:RecA-family ATPase